MSVEEMKSWLEALEDSRDEQNGAPLWKRQEHWQAAMDKANTAINDLRAAIEQAEKQEPVAWVDVHDYTNLYYRKPAQVDVVPLYYGPATPPTYDQGWKDGYKHGAWASTAAPVQEPVAWGVHDQIALNKAIANHPTTAAPVQEPVSGYIKKIEDLIQERDKWKAKAQRQWVGLTDEEIRHAMQALGWDGEAPSDVPFARAIEAKLREKNGQ